MTTKKPRKLPKVRIKMTKGTKVNPPIRWGGVVRNAFKGGKRR